jgi:hypothetical protein
MYHLPTVKYSSIIVATCQKEAETARYLGVSEVPHDRLLFGLAPTLHIRSHDSIILTNLIL